MAINMFSLSFSFIVKKFIFLMQSNDAHVITWMAKFVYRSMSKRSDILLSEVQEKDETLGQTKEKHVRVCTRVRAHTRTCFAQVDWRCNFISRYFILMWQHLLACIFGILILSQGSILFFLLQTCIRCICLIVYFICIMFYCIFYILYTWQVSDDFNKDVYIIIILYIFPQKCIWKYWNISAIL